MRIVHASHGKFHHLDLARQLHARDLLECFFTGYPKWKLKHEDLPHERISTFPWVETPYMALIKMRLMRGGIRRHTERLLKTTFDRHVAGHLPECEAFIALSGSGLTTGRIVQQRGGIYACDRGSSHIVVQNRLLHEEYERQGETFAGIDPWVIERELAEYEEADVITVPSEFARQTFLAQGVRPAKIAKIPYGVDLDRFNKVADPPKDVFRILFVGSVSFQKGVPDLLLAFEALDYPRKQLTIVGVMSEEMRAYLSSHPAVDNVEFTGHCPQSRLKEIFSRSHVMVLPSIQEGLALVMAQALACGCPVIASKHTGARDLFEDGEQGFIVPIRDPVAITERLQRLADNRDLQKSMSEAALKHVRENLGGWDVYGERMVEALRCSVGHKQTASSRKLDTRSFG